MAEGAANTEVSALRRESEEMGVFLVTGAIIGILLGLRFNGLRSSIFGAGVPAGLAARPSLGDEMLDQLGCIRASVPSRGSLGPRRQ